MWRRTAGHGLTGFGFSAIAAATTLAILGPASTDIPLAETVSSTAHGTGLTVFSPGTLTQDSGVEVTARRITTGAAGSPGTGQRTAIRTSGTVLSDAAGNLISTDEFTFCLDRRTGAATEPCPAARHNGAGGVAFAGQVLQFPPGTQRRDYDLFDPPTGRAWPVLFDDADFVNGLAVDRFVQEVPATVIGHQDVPGELAEAPAGSTVSADVVYSTTRTVWVEPATGIIVKDVAEPFRYLRAPGGKPVAILLFGSYGTDEPTIARDVATAAAGRAQISLRNELGPLGLGLLGLVALAAGVVVGRRAPARVPPEPERPAPAPVPAHSS